jgi:hypothetical protein
MGDINLTQKRDGVMKLSEIVLPWYAISQRKSIDQSDVFFKFIAVYIAFNAIYDCRYEYEHDPARKIEKFSEDEFIKMRHKNLLVADTEYYSAVKRLAEKGIINMQKPKEEPFRIKRLEYLNQVMRCIYQVRCNLFHGDKSPGDPRDVNLVESSYIILSLLIKPWIDPKLIDEWAGA